MKNLKALIRLTLLTALFAGVQAGAGLFWHTDGSSFPFTTLRGETVQIAGQGIYALDTYFKAPIFRGTDAVTLFVALPLLLIAGLLTARGALRGRILLTGVLAYLLYNAGSVALGVTYNKLFLVYVAYFSASLFAFILAFTSIDRQELAARVTPGAPLRGMATLMFVSALGLFAACCNPRHLVHGGCTRHRQLHHRSDLRV